MDTKLNSAVCTQCETPFKSVKFLKNTSSLVKYIVENKLKKKSAKDGIDNFINGRASVQDSPDEKMDVDAASERSLDIYDDMDVDQNMGSDDDSEDALSIHANDEEVAIPQRIPNEDLEEPKDNGPIVIKNSPHLVKMMVESGVSNNARFGDKCSSESGDSVNIKPRNFAVDADQNHNRAKFRRGQVEVPADVAARRNFSSSKNASSKPSDAKQPQEVLNSKNEKRKVKVAVIINDIPSARLSQTICEEYFKDGVCNAENCMKQHDFGKVKCYSRLMHILSKKSYENMSSISTYLNEIQNTQNSQVFMSSFCQTIKFLYNYGHFQIIAHLLRKFSKHVKHNSIWEIILEFIIESLHPKLVECLNILCPLVHSEQIHLSATRSKQLVWKLIDNPVGLQYVPKFLKAMPGSKQWDFSAPFVDHLMSSKTMNEYHYEICVELLKNCEFVCDNLDSLNLNFLLEFMDKISKMDACIGAIEIIKAFERSDVRLKKQRVSKLHNVVFLHPWCCVNCVLCNVWFDCQSPQDKILTIHNHVKNGNYACALNLLKVPNIIVNDIIEASVFGIMSDHESSSVVLESYLGHYRPDDKAENEFFQRLIWSLFSTTKQEGKLSQASTIGIVATRRKISFDKFTDVNPTHQIFKHLVNCDKIDEAWLLFEQNQFGLPCATLKSNIYLSQQQDHLVICYELIAKLIQKCQFQTAFTVLNQVLSMYQNKSHLWEKYSLDISYGFNKVLQGLANNKVAQSQHLAFELYRVHHKLSNNDFLFPIEILTCVRRQLLCVAVNNSQWFIANHLFICGQMQGIYPPFNIEIPLKLIVFSYMATEEIYLTLLAFFKELQSQLDLVKNQNISETDIYKKFTIHIHIKQCQVPQLEHHPNFSTSFDDNLLLFTKNRIKDVCMKQLQPPLKFFEEDARVVLMVDGRHALHYLTHQQLPVISPDLLKLESDNPSILPNVDMFKFSQH